MLTAAYPSDRQRCDYIRNGICYTNRRNSAWYYWGRWVLAGILVVVFILVLCALGYVPLTRLPLPLTGHR